ncbi:hypothetical protein OE88DRAFT_479241 [Heliocybe sulcata]|uniref:Tim44-like domain-containing protein n=1 Tax=Heliocybe sulcata TaxID=5364 RepID=A0A5C3N629_9AGAM|nr:hypothetical protein OE88DRAFT_479241 [Heliocybe sulcata]
MWDIAQVNGFPDVDVKRLWSLQLFTAHSLKNKWLAPFRATALRTCEQVDEALATMDIAAMKRVTSGAFQDEQVKLIKMMLANPDVFQTIRRDVFLVAPLKICSIRAAPGFVGAEEPRIGNRLIVQVCVEYRRIQAISIYNRDNKRITREGAIALDQAPEIKPSLDYLVLEKRMWYEGPWTVRDSLRPGADYKVQSM